MTPVSAARQPLARQQHDADRWRQDEFLAPAAALLPSVGLVSLDIFDTLLFRTCRRPEDVFHEIGVRAEAQGLLRQGLRAGEFAALREKAQATAYATLGREPRLEDIYARIPVALGPRDALIALEEEAEAAACVLNPSVASFVEHCRALEIPVVLLSDMYLGERRIRALLSKAGFDVERLVAHVIVSVDAGGYKMTGASYATLRALYPDLAADRILHIGDNAHADVRAARAAGLQALHYNVVRHDPDAVLALEELAADHTVPELTFVRRLAGALSAHVSPADRAWHRTGAHVVGPFVSALVEWTLDQCADAGITLVAPLMREGHLLAPFLRRAAKARRLEIDVRPLYVSRHSVALAGLGDTGEEFITRILDARRHVSIGDFFASLGLPVPEAFEAHRGTLTTSAHAIRQPDGQTLRSHVIEHLRRDDVQRALQGLVRAERRRLVDYLSDTLAPHQAAATLDIGFFGQIQRSLSVALAGEGHPVHLSHFLGFGHGPVVDDLLCGRDIRTFAGGYGADIELVRTIHRSAPVLEQLLQGPEGTTTGYLASDGRAVPLRERNPLPSRDIVLKTIVQNGATAFHELWLELREARPALISTLVGRRSAWCHLAHRFVAAPTRGEAERLGSLHDDVNFGSSTVLPFCPPEVEARMAEGGVTGALRQGLAAVPAVWPQGVVTRVDPGALIRRYAEQSRRPYVAEGHALARHLVQSGVTRVIGYGTGDVAVAFIEAATILGIQVVALVDSDARRHGTDVAGIPVLSLEAAVNLGIHTFAVLSIAHAAPIGDTIRRRYQQDSLVPLVFDFAHSSLIKVKHP